MHVRFFLKSNSTKPVQDLMLPDSGGDDDGVAYFVVGTDGAYPSFLGPDDGSSVLWVEAGPGGTRTQVTGSDPALLGTYARPGTVADLPRWRRRLQSAPATAIISIVGDSTSDEGTSAGYLYARLRSAHTRPGEALYGMTPDVFTDGVTTSGSKTFTSASANFTSADVGRNLSANNASAVPFSTTIASIDSPTQVQLSANAGATTTGLNFSIGRHIINRGNNGWSLDAWLNDPSKLAALVADAPHLIIASWLINDVRLGTCDLATAIARLQQFVSVVQAALPNTDIALRVPNPMLTANVSGLNFVQSAGGTINPAGAAQAYSDLIRKAYLSLEGVYANVTIIDVSAEVFGSVCRASSPLMADQLHPSPSQSWNGYTPTPSGYTEIADCLARHIGVTRGNWVVTPASYRTVRYFTVIGGTATTVQLGARNLQDPVAAQFPITSSDLLFVDGFDGPIALNTGQSFARPYGGTNILIMGLTTDFTAAAGRWAMVVSNHADATTGDRQIVSVDLPSIAAGATSEVTVSVAGASTGALPDAVAVLCAPPASFITAGLRLLNCYPTAAGTVTLIVNNPTGAAVDLAASNFAFWVVR